MELILIAIDKVAKENFEGNVMIQYLPRRPWWITLLSATVHIHKIRPMVKPGI